MENLYSYGYVAVLFSVILWDYHDSRDKPVGVVKILLSLSILAYLAGVIFSHGTIFYKITRILPRDVIVLLLVIVLSHFVIRNKIATALMMVCMFAVLKFYYMDVLQTSFVSQKAELFAQGEFLFDIKDDKMVNRIKEILAEYDVTVKKAFPGLKNRAASELDDYYLLDIGNKFADEADEIMEKLYASDTIDWVERNEVIQLGKPLKGKGAKHDVSKNCVNDPLVSRQWAFSAMNMCDFFNAVQKNRFKKRVKVAILDTGVDAEHEDLKGSFISTDRTFDKDGMGHGTHCAGIAGAVTNNRGGIASFFPGENKYVKITSIKVLQDNGSGSQHSIIRGVIKAVDTGAKVLSLSLGGPSDDLGQKAWEEAVKYAASAGAIIVVAAGNENDNAKNYAPAGVKGVIAVSAVNKDINKADFSNYVNELDMAVAAPGVDITSTFPGSEYRSFDGTSMAAPHVAGLIGIMKAIKPNLTTDQAFKILKRTGLDTADPEKTGKFIQPAKAITALR